METRTGTDGSSEETFHIVGIGASAGGLDAFLDLLGALPADTGMAFVIIQHLEPHSESQLANILARATPMTVLQATDGLPVERNQVYVIPPNVVMVLREGCLRLAPRPESPKPNYPIDIFFESLAAEKDAESIGVVLSGSASDGAQGLRTIKSRCGTTFAQDERTARFGSMPHAAIATGAVDFVLPPKRIAEELSKIDSHPLLAAPTGQQDETLEEQDSEVLAQVLGRLRASCGVDFSQYKQSTIRRRLGRRLVIRHLDTLDEYLQFINTNPEELHDLYRDVLISVTAFFREPAMFDALGAMIQEKLANRGASEPLRIWVPGCATGEEAYSLAILALECLERTGKSIPVQVFGTDISDTAIDRARTGVYSSKAVQEIRPEQRQRFFLKVDSGCRIKQQVRDCCVFARHDLTSDPPFSQMDLVSCRNVFIYLSAGLQQRVVPALHYSLKPTGLLILGDAETIGNRTDLFGFEDHDNKIYRKKAVPSHLSMSLHLPARTDEPAANPRVRPPMPAPALIDMETRAAHVLRDIYAPPGVLVNQELQVVHVYGKTGFYMDPVPPDAPINLLRVLRPELLHPVRHGLDAAFSKGQPFRQNGLQVNGDGQSRRVDLSIVPLSDGSRACLVLFEGEADDTRPRTAPRADADTGSAAVELTYAQRELSQTKDYLRKVVEQHDAVTEELRAANEETRSSNEELQSTNEELRTAKEQLQSANEELTTVNDELQHRNGELSRASNDLSNILSAAMIPIVMVSTDFRLRRFTPAAERLLGLVPNDSGRPLTEIRCTIEIADLGSLLAETIETLRVQQRRVQSRDGHLHDLFVRPYRTVDDRIDGAVLTFIDVDEVARSLEREALARRFADAIVETVQHPLLVLDAELRVVRATGAFYKTFGVRPEETLNRTVENLGGGQWNIPELRRLLDQSLLRDAPFHDFEVRHEFPSIGIRTMRLNARRVDSAAGSYNLVLAIEDITDRLEIAEVQYRRLFESAKDGIVVIDAEAGLILDVNPYIVDLLQYPRVEFLRAPFREAPVFRDTPSLWRLVPDTLEHGTIRCDSVAVKAQDGRELIVDIIANSYRVKERSFIQLNVRDVTERRRDEQRLRSANQDLQQFAFAASHDLQEPLRTITNYLELIKRDTRERLPEQTETHLNFVLSAADRMRQLVVDLLGYSHVVRAELKIAEVNIEVALSAAMMNLQMAIQSSGARITFDELPTVAMDETQLIQLMQNLLSNAIKYAGERPPRIHVSAQHVGPEWIISVRDEGIGLDMKYADQIFNIFKRLHGRSHPGTGVGLAVCKKIVERRGGRIWVESAPGEGATFYFSLPTHVKHETYAEAL